jgi:hypothetical protein
MNNRHAQVNLRAAERHIEDAIWHLRGLVSASGLNPGDEGFETEVLIYDVMEHLTHQQARLKELE